MKSLFFFPALVVQDRPSAWLFWLIDSISWLYLFSHVLTTSNLSSCLWPGCFKLSCYLIAKICFLKPTDEDPSSLCHQASGRSYSCGWILMSPRLRATARRPWILQCRSPGEAARLPHHASLLIFCSYWTWINMEGTKPKYWKSSQSMTYKNFLAQLYHIMCLCKILKAYPLAPNRRFQRYPKRTAGLPSSIFMLKKRNCSFAIDTALRQTAILGPVSLCTPEQWPHLPFLISQCSSCLLLKCLSCCFTNNIFSLHVITDLENPLYPLFFDNFYSPIGIQFKCYFFWKLLCSHWIYCTQVSRSLSPHCLFLVFAFSDGLKLQKIRLLLSRILLLGIYIHPHRLDHKCSYWHCS